MNNFLRGWLASEESDLDKIEVKRIYIDMCNGNLHDAIMLSQIMYWHGNSKETGKPRLKVKRDGYLWLVKSHADWWEECRIKGSTAKQCLNRLNKLGLIIREYHRFNGLRTSHIRIDYDVLSNLIQQHTTVGHLISDRTDISYPTEQTSHIRPITDTTTDTTTEVVERPPVFKLWEQEVGALTPMISDHLKDAVKTYPYGWVHDAIKEARISTNRVTWKYVKAILARWQSEGRTTTQLEQQTKSKPNEFEFDIMSKEW